MPGVPAVEDGEGLRDVEVEPLVGREGPEAKVEAVRGEGEGQGEDAAEGCLADEGGDGAGGRVCGRGGYKARAEGEEEDGDPD